MTSHTTRRALLCTPSLAAALLLAPAASAQVSGIASPKPDFLGEFGCAVAGVPDLNGDGRGDIVVGARSENVGNSPDDCGRAYVYSGATGKPIRAINSPNKQFLGVFGFSVGGIPDVNGDKRGDIIIGAPYEGLGGRAYIFSGATGALLHVLISPNEEFFGTFGFSVAGVRDINGDGRGDVIVGAPFERPLGKPLNSGRVYIFSGATGQHLRTIASPFPATNGRFGWSVAGIDDMNGNKRGDVAIGAVGESSSASFTADGRVYLVAGTNGNFGAVLASPHRQDHGQFGYSVSGVPDVNGDGRGDVIVGAPQEAPGNFPPHTGRAYIYSGSGALLVQMTSPYWQTGGRFGHSVAGVPDLNGDGRGDVAIGARNEIFAGGAEEAGRVYIRSGVNGALLSVLTSPAKQAGGNFGHAVGGIPDVNGNGKGDVVIGAWTESLGEWPYASGRVYIFRY